MRPSDDHHLRAAPAPRCRRILGLGVIAVSKRRKGARKNVKTPTGARKGPSAGGGVLVGEYYQLAFYRLIREIQQAGQYTRAPSAQRWAFWQTVTLGVYPPEEGHALAEGYLRHIEDRLRAAVSANSIAYWLHLFRRLAPMAIGEQTQPVTVLLTRAALEAAVQRWAATKPCGRVAASTDVPPEAILKGYLVEQRDDEMLKLLADRPQLVLTDLKALTKPPITAQICTDSEVLSEPVRPGGTAGGDRGGEARLRGVVGHGPDEGPRQGRAAAGNRGS
jgi:hypothetical protein